MRVLCVKPIDNPDESCKASPRPQLGDIDIVVDTELYFGRPFYVLERFRKDEAFGSECFAVLPDASADEMAEAEREAIVNLETVLV